MIAVHELMSPLGATVLHGQSLAEAHEKFLTGQPVVVLGLADRPIGLIGSDDLTMHAESDPEGWTNRRCAYAMTPIEGFVSVDDAVDGVLRRYRQGETVPMPVLRQDTAVGILYPAAVFQWHAQQPPLTSNHRTLTHGAPL